MLKLPAMLLFVIGFVFATSSSAQDRGESERQIPRSNMQQSQRGERADSMRGSQSERFSSRNGRASESMQVPRYRGRQDEERGQEQRRTAPDFGRDPRAETYRDRPLGGEPSANVPRNLQLAIERAQSTHGGKVLSADRIRYRGQDTYRVKLLTPGGRVRVVQLSEPPAEAQTPSKKQTNGED